MISATTETILGLDDYFDYDGYVNACQKRKLTPDVRGVFLQKAGILEGARRDNPGDVVAAYLKIIEEMSVSHNQPKSTVSSLQSAFAAMPAPSDNCGSCGGGRIR